MSAFYSRFLSTIVLAGILTSGAWGGEIRLRNGDRLTGTVSEITTEFVRFRSKYQATLDIPLDDVLEMASDEELVLNLATGERLVTRFISVEGRDLVVESLSLGNVRLARANLFVPVSSKGIAREAVELSTSVTSRIRGKGGDERQPSPDSGKPSSASSPEASRVIGEKPVTDDIRRVFLRQTSVLLRKNEFAIDAGLYYLVDEERIPGLQNRRQREIGLPVLLRYGMRDRVEGFISLPILQDTLETNNFGDVQRSRRFGVGDLSVGLKYHAVQEKASTPDVILFGSATAPTGSKKTEENGVALGSGHGGITAGVQFLKTYDPAVLFAGLSYSQFFGSHRFFTAPNQYVQPGRVFGYNFGAAFALNDDISLSGQVTGRFISNDKVDGSIVEGTSRDLISFRLALTSRLARATYMEPSLTFGMTGQSPDVILGVSLIHNFSR